MFSVDCVRVFSVYTNSLEGSVFCVGRSYKVNVYCKAVLSSLAFD